MFVLVKLTVDLKVNSTCQTTVGLLSGALMSEIFYMCLKKLQRPMNCLISCTLVKPPQFV